MKRFLLSGVAVLAFAPFALFPMQAFSQKAQIMKPETQWMVKKIDGQAGDYCTLARRYVHGTILTVAQNANAETSFALDFQRPILKGKQAMDVVLDPGAGQQRKFELDAVSNQAFVARLGRDDAFFTALKKTGLLRVEVEGQSYSFNLSDVDDGKYQLNKCVTSLPPLIRQQEPVVAAAVDSVEVIDGPESVKTLVADGAGNGAGISKESTIAEVIERVSPAPKLASKEVSIPIEPPALSEVLEAEEKANVPKAREQLAAVAPVETGAVSEVEIQALSSEIANLRSDNARLQSALAEMNRLVDEGTVVQNDLEQENVKLREELQAVYAEQQNTLAQKDMEVSAREREILALNEAQAKAIAQRDAELARLRAEQENFTVVHSTLDTIKVENEELKQALLSSRKELEAMKSRDVARAEGEEAVAALRDEYLTQIQGQEQEIASLLQQNEALQKELNHMGAMGSSIEASLFGDVAAAALAPAASSEPIIITEAADAGDVDVVDDMAVAQDVVETIEWNEPPVRATRNDVIESPYMDAEALNAAQLQEIEEKRGMAQRAVSKVQVEEEALSFSDEIEPVSEEISEEANLVSRVPDELELEPPVLSEVVEVMEVSREPLESVVEERTQEVVQWAEEVQQDAVEASPAYVDVVEERQDAIYNPAFNVADVVSAPLEIVDTVSNAQRLVYQWSQSGLYGSAEQRPFNSGEEGFDLLVQDYLTRTQERCQGDFAIVPDGSVEQSGVRFDRYDVACVGADVDSSAALLFFNKAGTFTVLAHEGPSALLGGAIDEREQVASAIVKGS